MKDKTLCAISLTGLAALAFGIGCIDIRVNTGPSSGGTSSGGGPVNAFALTPPANSGSIGVGISELLASPGSETCFPISQGWNKYVTFPKFFEGPNGTHSPTVYPNLNNLSTLVIKTCDPANNNASLQTGIVIVELLTGVKVCAQGGCGLSGFGNLTIDTKVMSSGKKYQALVYFKSGTVAPLTSVTINWSYQ